MIDTPILVRAVDGDARGQVRSGLSDAALIVLAQEVITRLARWANDSAQLQKISADGLPQPDVEALCNAILGTNPQQARDMLIAAHHAGASHETLCVHHLGAASRHLGELWESDLITFREMGLAAGRMLHLLRDFRELAPPFKPRGARSALFATVPGEMHVLGVTMARDLFQGDGWDVDLRLDQSEAQLAELVKNGGYPIIGLSAGSPERVRALARVIVELRVAAPKLLIFVSGQIARLEPDIAVRVGADGAAWDMDHCRSELERLHALVPVIAGQV